MALNKNSLRMHRDLSKTIGIILIGIAVFIVVCALIYNAFLNQGHIEIVDLFWVDHHPTSDLPYVHLEGTVANSGSSTALSVQLGTRIYDSVGTLLRTEITDLGDIPAGTFKKISLDIQYSGKADKCRATLTWKPFGG